MIHYLPNGCITSAQLRSLANRIDDLEMIHRKMGGGVRDRPCLRRIEAHEVHGVRQISAYVRITDDEEIRLVYDVTRDVWREKGGAS